MAKPSRCSGRSNYLAVLVAAWLLCPSLTGATNRTEALDWSRITPFPGCEQAALSLQLLIPGAYSANELPANPGGRWYALTRLESRFVLRMIELHLRPIDNPRVTGDRSVPGVSVESGVADSALFFFRGPNGWREETVQAWLPARVRLKPGTSVGLHGVGAHRWELLGTPLAPTRYEGIQMYKLRIHDRESGRSQDIGGWTGLPPSIEWVGDLDGDGDLDLLLLDVTSETGSRSWTLFLSSKAAGNDILGRAAEFGHPGC